MSAAIAATLCVAMVLFRSPSLGADDGSITLDAALALARSRAPKILAARARVDEARAGLLGASRLLRDNPTLDVASGPRRSRGGDSVDVDLALVQTFETGGRRAARIAGAESGLARAAARSEDALRVLLRDAAVAFLQALGAEERLRLAAGVERIAADLEHTAESRHRRGDIAVLDLNLARSLRARAGSDVRAGEADAAATRGALRLQLGMGAEDPLRVTGDLAERRPYDVETLLARAADRPDVRRLAAELGEAEAELRLGQASIWPDVGVGVRYQREDGDDIALGALTFALPLFDRGQELRARAAARRQRLRLELEAKRRAVTVEVRTAFAVYRHRLEAVEALQREVLPRLDEDEGLTRRSYEAGQVGLAEVLLVRRETFETRRAYLDRLLEAAIAGAELEAQAGVQR